VSVVWHPNCEHILSASSADTSIRIWDLRQEKMIQYYAAHTGSVNSTDFHSSGNYLISASSDETSKIFDLLEGRGLFTLKAHHGPVNCATFTNDGQYFATAGHDKQIIIWKSNLISQFDPNDSIAETITEDEIIQSPPEPSRQKTTTCTKVPLKSALRRTPSHESKPSSSYADSLSDHKNNNDIADKGRHRSNNDVVDKDDNLNSGDTFSISQGIINQLRTLTDSVLLIEERLSILEDKFEAHCTSDNPNN